MKKRKKKSPKDIKITDQKAVLWFLHKYCNRNNAWSLRRIARMLGVSKSAAGKWWTELYDVGEHEIVDIFTNIKEGHDAYDRRYYGYECNSKDPFGKQIDIWSYVEKGEFLKWLTRERAKRQIGSDTLIE